MITWVVKLNRENSASSEWQDCTFVALLQSGNWNKEGMTTANICNRKHLTKCRVTVLCHSCHSSLAIHPFTLKCIARELRMSEAMILFLS